MKKEKFASDTSKRSAKDWVRALAVLLGGLIVAHLGVTLFLLSELGTDTFTVFIQGLARTVQLPVANRENRPSLETAGVSGFFCLSYRVFSL